MAATSEPITVRQVLLEAGYSWQRTRTWCQTGQAIRTRQGKQVVVHDEDSEAKKKLMEQAYQIGEVLGLSVWCEDEAGPYQPTPYAGTNWQPQGQPVQHPHHYQRGGTAKLLTLFHPATGQVRVKGVKRSTNAILQPWLKAQLWDILQTLPEPVERSAYLTRSCWEMWRVGLTNPGSLSLALPPLRVLVLSTRYSAVIHPVGPQLAQYG
jgi:hypothetical protein